MLPISSKMVKIDQDKGPFYDEARVNIETDYKKGIENELNQIFTSLKDIDKYSLLYPESIINDLYDANKNIIKNLNINIATLNGNMNSGNYIVKKLKNIFLGKRMKENVERKSFYENLEDKILEPYTFRTIAPVIDYLNSLN